MMSGVPIHLDLKGNCRKGMGTRVEEGYDEETTDARKHMMGNQIIPGGSIIKKPSCKALCYVHTQKTDLEMQLALQHTWKTDETRHDNAGERGVCSLTSAELDRSK